MPATLSGPAGETGEGERDRQSVPFMNLPDTQLTFRFLSRKPDFEKLHRAFRASLCSWQWL